MGSRAAEQLIPEGDTIRRPRSGPCAFWLATPGLQPLLTCPLDHFVPTRAKPIPLSGVFVDKLTVVNEVAIPRQDYEDGQTLPRICALSGEPADRLYRRKLAHLQKWVYALLPLGIPFVFVLKIVVGVALDRFTDWTPPGSVWIPLLALPFALGWYFKAVKLPGWIPLSINAHREVVRQRQLRWGSAGAFVIFGFITMVSIQSWGTVGVLPGLLAVLALGSFFSLSWELGLLDVGVRIGPGNHRVTLSNVHPTFAQASLEQFGRSPTSTSN